MAFNQPLTDFLKDLHADLIDETSLFVNEKGWYRVVVGTYEGAPKPTMATILTPEGCRSITVPPMLIPDWWPFYRMLADIRYSTHTPLGSLHPTHFYVYGPCHAPAPEPEDCEHPVVCVIRRPDIFGYDEKRQCVWCELTGWDNYEYSASRGF